MKKQFIISLLWLAVFCAAPVFSQTERSEEKSVRKEEYQAVCRADYVGKTINLNLVNAGVNDFMNYIADEFGFSFVIDKSVKRKPFSMNIENTPWNRALGEILQTQGLALQCREQYLLITKKKTK